MRIDTVELADFRNIAAAKLQLSPHFTALVGPNGQGKTNTLEALYLTAALRPLRSVPRQALVREGQSAAQVSLRVFRESTGLSHDLRVELEASRRRLVRDDKATAAAQFIGTLVAVAFTPDDLNLAKGGPDARRRFLDRAILNVRPAFLARALRYQKVVRERNRLLAEPGNDAQLEAFDQVVVREGAAITDLRQRYIEELTPRVEQFFGRIADPAPPLALAYDSRLLSEGPVASVEELEARFAQKLESRRPLDRARRTDVESAARLRRQIAVTRTIDEPLRDPGLASRFRFGDDRCQAVFPAGYCADHSRMQQDFDAGFDQQLFQHQLRDFGIVNGALGRAGHRTATLGKEP